MRGRREQFQLTYAKVKVISMDKEEDQWVKKKRRKFRPAGHERLMRNRGGPIFHPLLCKCHGLY